MHRNYLAIAAGVSALGAALVAAPSSCRKQPPALAIADAAAPLDAGDELPPIIDDYSDQWDGDINPFVGSWSYLPGNPANCKLRIAQDPSTSVDALKFMPCPSGRPGCQRLVVTWTNNPYDAIATGRPEAVRLIKGRPHIIYNRRWPTDAPMQYTGGSEAQITVVQPLDGLPVFAVGTFTPKGWPYCAYRAIDGDPGIAIHALPDPTLSWDIFAWSSWNTLTTLVGATFPHNQVPGYYCVVLSLSGEPGHGVVSCENESPNFPVLFDTNAQSITAVTAGLPNVERFVYVPVRDGWLAQNFGPPMSLELIRFDGSIAPLVADPPHSIFWIAVDRSDADRIVWIEVDGSDPFYNPVLWTSDYGAQTSALSRRLVSRISTQVANPGVDMVANAGMVLQIIGPTTALLTRLLDGWSWTVESEPDEVFQTPLWVDDSEVWLLTADAKIPIKPWAITRLSRAGLGAPTVPPGL